MRWREQSLAAFQPERAPSEERRAHGFCLSIYTVRKCDQRLPKPSVRPPSPWAALRVIFLISFRMKTIEMAAAVLRGAE